MPPALGFASHSGHIATPILALKDQWKNPEDILSILMIIGGDIVRSALSQLVSSRPRPFTPVAFSFGWVAYSFSAILSAVGSRQLVPAPDCRCILIEADSGYPRDVNSWVLSRLFRDYESRHNERSGLEIAFFDTKPDRHTGKPDRDWVYYLGALVILVQIWIAAIPGVLDGNWFIMVVACGGNLLAQMHGALPQWQQELWDARPIKDGKQELVCLTKGNGSPYVMVIRSSQGQLRLADLAGGREARGSSNPAWTVCATLTLTLLWIILLLTMQGVKDGHWYMLAIGATRMLQNVMAAGARREPAALGFHLKERETIHRKKVFEAIQKAEELEPRVGLSLLDIFFPGGLRVDEEQWKQDTKNKYQQAQGKE